MDLTAAPVGAAIENLYPALMQCFAIILCGYVVYHLRMTL